MSEPTSGYSFLLEFNQTAVNKVIVAVFDADGGAIPTSFHHDQPGQGGMISSRGSQTGRFVFQQYLAEGLLGYEVSVYDPKVLLLGGLKQQVSLDVGFDLTIFRQLKVFKTGDALAMPIDPGDINPDNPYPLAFDSGMFPSDPPSVRGRLVVVLNLAKLPLGKDNRVTLNAAESTLDAVERVELHGVQWPDALRSFIERVAAQAVSTLLKNEIKEIDITPVFGIFDQFGVALREPIHLRIGETLQLPSLAVGMHERGLLSDGRPTEISFETETNDFGLQISEGFFLLLLRQLQNGHVLPRRFNTHGASDDTGAILLSNIKASFQPDVIRIQLLVTFEGIADLYADTSVRITSAEDGVLSVSLENTALHLRLQGLLSAFQAVFNTLTFFLLDQLCANLLGNLLQAVVNRPVGKTLEEFLKNGKLGFSLDSPIRHSKFRVRVIPKDLSIVPGRLLLLGDVNAIKEP